MPIKIDIIKHAREIDGKSTAIHAAILAPEDVRIFTYPNFPDILDKEEVYMTATTYLRLFYVFKTLV